jgi:general secretion pathway protein H
MTSRNNVAGFTLIEILVVLVIFGLCLGIVAGFVPRRNTRLELANAAEALAGALRLARAHAISTGAPVGFALAPDGRGYMVDGAARILPADISIAATGPIRFAPDGSASGGAVRLATPGRALAVQVDWLTGRVTLADVP